MFSVTCKAIGVTYNKLPLSKNRIHNGSSLENDAHMKDYGEHVDEHNF